MCTKLYRKFNKSFQDAYNIVPVGGRGLDIQKAIAFIEQKGTKLERYRLRYLLGKEKDRDFPLRYLKGLQNNDGGFPYEDERGKLSSINSTGINLALMVELGLKESDICKKTVKYLLDVQHEDGSWDENKTINKYDPPFWNTPGDLKTKMWLTANISNYLIQLSYKQSQALGKAKQFLLKNRDEEGKFAGFLHSTWIAIGVFGQLEGIDSEIVRKALKVMDQNLDRLEDGASDFVWFLECLYVAEISRDNHLVRKCIDKLNELQRTDGAWPSGNGEKYTASTTLAALRILKMYEVW